MMSYCPLTSKGGAGSGGARQGAGRKPSRWRRAQKKRERARKKLSDITSKIGVDALLTAVVATAVLFGANRLGRYLGWAGKPATTVGMNVLGTIGHSAWGIQRVAGITAASAGFVTALIRAEDLLDEAATSLVDRANVPAPNPSRRTQETARRVVAVAEPIVNVL